MSYSRGERIGARALWLRGGALIVIAIAALVLRAIEPGTFAWLPLRTSCGAASGLPCIFCGFTRAMHHLLNGDLTRALYLNWLVFPLSAVLLIVAIKLMAEVAFRRRVLLPLPRLQLTPRVVVVGIAAIFALWTVQVSLAVRFRKDELLNPRGLLYSLLVR